MTAVDPQAGERLAAMLESSPEPATVAAGCLSTPRVLTDLARAWSERVDGDRRRDLEVLCRKIHVVGKVRAVYRAGWRRKKGAEPLPVAWWPLLIAVLLAHASSAESGEVDRGLALKSLNAALVGFDLAAAAGMEDSPELLAWSEQLLDRSRGLGTEPP